MKKQNAQPTSEQRFEDYLKHGESAAMYMHGLADAWESTGANGVKTMIHHLRCHAEELGMGTLWVRHGYRDNETGGSK